MKSKPLLSVIIPAYNVEKYIEKCMDSILCQKVRPIEIIVIEAGSSDSTGDVILRYSKKHPEVKPILPGKRLFCGAARNVGLEFVTGDFYAFCDADDTIPNGAYNEMLRVAERYNADLVLGNYNYLDKDSVISSMVYENPMAVDRCFESCNVSCCNKLYRTSFSGKLRFDDNNKTAEDAAYSIEIYRMLPNVAYTTKMVYNYVIKKDDEEENLVHEEYYNGAQVVSDCLRVINDGFEKPFVKWHDLWSQLYVDYTSFMFNNYWKKIGNADLKREYFNKIQYTFQRLQDINPVCDYTKNNCAGVFQTKFGLDYVTFMSLKYEEYIFAQLLCERSNSPMNISTFTTQDDPMHFVKMSETGKMGMRIIIRAAKGWLKYKLSRKK